MGMDMYLFRARNKKQFNEEGFWNKCIDLRDMNKWEDDDFTSPAQLWYGRKFWALLEYVFPEYDDKMCGEFIEVNKTTLERMIEFACNHPDYFGGFNTVPALCQALYSYDEARKNGFSYFMECDW